MLPQSVIKAMSRVMLVALSATTVGQARAGILYASQGVTVNGKPVSGETAVFPRDKVQTSALDTDLRLEGTLITLRPHTALVLGEMVEVGCGGVNVFTFTRAAVHVGSAIITPTSNDATKLQILNSGGTITVTAVVGEATITSAGQSSPLAPGNFLSLAGDKACPVLAEVQTGAPLPTASTHRKLIGILLGAGGAGAAAAVLVTRRGEGSVSPSRP